MEEPKDQGGPCKAVPHAIRPDIEKIVQCYLIATSDEVRQEIETSVGELAKGLPTLATLPKVHSSQSIPHSAPGSPSPTEPSNAAKSVRRSKRVRGQGHTITEDEDGEADNGGRSWLRKSTETSIAVTGMAKKRRRLSKQPDYTIALDSDCTSLDMIKLRDDFLSQLEKLPMPIKDGKEREEEIEPFGNEMAVSVTNFFFDEVMSYRSLERMAQFAVSYKQPVRNEPDAGAGTRTMNLSSDTSLPKPIRKLLRAFSEQQSSMLSSNAVAQHIKQVDNALNTLSKYREVRTLIDEHDPEMVSFLTKKGVKASQGVSWATKAIDLLADEAQIDRVQFSRICQRAKSVDIAVKTFGSGVIVLLPPGGMSRLHKVGPARTSMVCNLLNELVPWFRKLCQLTEQAIYRPFKDGATSLPVSPIRMTPSKDGIFMQIMNNAIDKDTTGFIHPEEEEED